MESKELRIAELQRQIEEIKKEKPLKFALIEVVPDCGAGIQDSENIIVISNDATTLVEYCEKEFNYTPHFERNKKDGKKGCDKWYKLGYTSIEIM